MVSASIQQPTVLVCGLRFTQAAPQTSMDKKSASRIQSANARTNGGGTTKGNFPARAQRAADKRQCSSTGPDYSPNGGGSRLLVASAVGIGAYLLYKVGQYTNAISGNVRLLLSWCACVFEDMHITKNCDSSTYGFIVIKHAAIIEYYAIACIDACATAEA